MNKINGLLACGICLCAVACGKPMAVNSLMNFSGGV